MKQLEHKRVLVFLVWSDGCSYFSTGIQVVFLLRISGLSTIFFRENTSRTTCKLIAVMASVAQLDVHLTGDQVAGSTPAEVGNILLWRLIMKFASLGGSVGCTVRLETRRLRVQPPPRSVTFFRGDWSWNIFYARSLPSADSRRAVVSFWRKNVHNTG